jgi:hypothetical protein
MHPIFPRIALVLLGLSTSACALTNQLGLSSTAAIPTPAPVQAAITRPAPTVTAIPPTPTEPAPEITGQRVLVDFACQPENRLDYPQDWCLLESGSAGGTDIFPPIPEAQLIDYAPATNQLLYATHFPDHGAGPGGLSAIDLWGFDVETTDIWPVVSDELVIDARWGPDGQSIAYVIATPTTYQLRWRAASGDDRLLAEDVPHTLSVSPDGEWVAFTRESGYEVGGTPGVYAVSLQSGEEIPLSDTDRGGWGSITDEIVWSWDSEHVLLPVQDQLLRAAADGSSSAFLTIDERFADEPWYLGQFQKMLWLPDGQRFVATVNFGGPGVGPVGTSTLVLELDALLETVVAAATVTADGGLLGWDVPGESVWINPYETPGPPVSLPLPS